MITLLSSSASLFSRRVAILGIALGTLLSCPSPGQARELSGAELDSVGRRIWQNECAGTVEGLTSWNTGESFASLGIGHFIWYPPGQEGPFEESFPKLVAWMKNNGVTLPTWLEHTKDCPWSTRESFLRDKDSGRQRDLRVMLSRTVRLQTQFIIHRLDLAKPKFQKAGGTHAGKVARNMDLLQQTAAGNFAMIDYVNFKGEGLNPKERYNGEGWGLLQVLIDMDASAPGDAPAAFARASSMVLTRRVRNSPAERKEQRWLPGWKNRCATYAGK